MPKRYCKLNLPVKSSLIYPVNLHKGNCPKNMKCSQKRLYCVCQNGFVMDVTNKGTECVTSGNQSSDVEEEKEVVSKLKEQVFSSTFQSTTVGQNKMKRLKDILSKTDEENQKKTDVLEKKFNFTKLSIIVSVTGVCVSIGVFLIWKCRWKKDKYLSVSLEDRL